MITAVSNAAADAGDVTKAQSCDLHHCQLLIGRIRQLTTTAAAEDMTDTDPSCMSTHSPVSV